ncbi:MAG: P-II family nitrogen regulator [Gammaproteobacteria bacterium]
MEYRKITAIIRREAVNKVAKNLKEIGVTGMTITKVEGYGHHAKLYAAGKMALSAKIEIFTSKEAVRKITDVIMAIAHTGRSGDGIVAVHPVEELYRIQTRSNAD